VPCPDHDASIAFCDACDAADAADLEPVTFIAIEPVRICWLCGQAGPSADLAANGLCVRCDKGQARLQAWLERQARKGQGPDPS
jgi:hypothetical protein